MNGMGKLGTALTAVFAVLLAALLGELLYVLCRRHRLRRQRFSDQGSLPASKELLYFFCWKNRSRVEPDAAQPPPRDGPTPTQPAEAVDEVEKWQRMYGASRILFTIREEEREGMESDYSSSTEKGRKTRTVSMDEGLGSVQETVVAVREDEEEEEATPFTTPCASPPYYTPSPSPTRERVECGRDKV